MGGGGTGTGRAIEAPPTLSGDVHGDADADAEATRRRRCSLPGDARRRRTPRLWSMNGVRVGDEGGVVVILGVLGAGGTSCDICAAMEGRTAWRQPPPVGVGISRRARLIWRESMSKFARVFCRRRYPLARKLRMRHFWIDWRQKSPFIQSVMTHVRLNLSTDSRIQTLTLV
jgi:hypothetical protein